MMMKLSILLVCLFMLTKINQANIIEGTDGGSLHNNGGNEVAASAAAKNRIYSQILKQFLERYYTAVAAANDGDAEGDDELTTFGRQIRNNDAVGFWKRHSAKLSKARKFWKRFYDENNSISEE